ncbi:MAG: CDP-archaeol synthase, partial [archaeon]|nr:CDP-archaeol synthase [archaeon]
MSLDLIHFFTVVVLITIPIYLSNSFALILGGKTYLDFGKNFFDGRPLFGKGKTFRGTIAGIVVGSVGALAVSVFLSDFTTVISANYFHYGFLLAAGAMLGDLVGSFIKRRTGLARGESVLLLDQLDFVAG